MPRLFWSCLAAALIAAGPALAAMPSESAEQNVRESAQYERLLCTNPAFRAKRIAQECGPLTDFGPNTLTGVDQAMYDQSYWPSKARAVGAGPGLGRTESTRPGSEALWRITRA